MMTSKKILELVHNGISWMSRRLRHKLEHLTLNSLKSVVLKGGPALLAIVLIWEVTEDVLFPLLFGFLGNNVHPVFYTLIPASWLLCLHWLAVPILWGLWTKIKNKHEGRN